MRRNREKSVLALEASGNIVFPCYVKESLVKRLKIKYVSLPGKKCPKEELAERMIFGFLRKKSNTRELLKAKKSVWKFLLPALSGDS